ncbi:MAG: hypothetical protein R3D25_06280 [Geminicoccaceae bacterium]
MRRRGGEALEEIATADDGGERMAVADGLAEGGEIGRHADERLVAAERMAKAGDDLVEDQKHAPPLAERLQALRIAGLERDAADIVHERLDQHGGDVVVGGCERLLDGGEVVEGQDGGRRHGFGEGTRGERVGPAEPACGLTQFIAT